MVSSEVAQKSPFNKKRALSERGAALVELAIVLPFLFFTTFCVIDLGRWLNAHLTASRYAYEAARYAASVPLLETGDYIATITGTGLVNVTTAHIPFHPNQSLVMNRLAQAVKQRTKNDSTAQVSMTSKYTIDPNNSESRIVKVDIVLPFNSIFSVIGLHDVKAAANVSYLN